MRKCLILLTRIEWYLLPASPGRKREDGKKGVLSYLAMYSAIAHAFKECGIVSCKKVHFGRKQGVQQAMNRGADRDEVMALGGWEKNQFDQSYDMQLSWNAFLIQARYTQWDINNVHHDDIYHIRRGTIEVPHELLKGFCAWAKEEWEKATQVSTNTYRLLLVKV